MMNVYTNLNSLLVASEEQITSFLLESPQDEVKALLSRLLNSSSISDEAKTLFLIRVENAFSLMLSAVLDKLDTERANLEKGISFYQEIGLEGEELSNDQYKLSSVNYIIESLKSFLHLPYYEKVKVMSNAEACDRKRKKIDKLDRDIASLRSEKAEKEQLLARLKESFVQNDHDTSSLISQGKEIVAELKKYTADSEDSSFAGIESKIAKAEAKMEELKAMHPTSFKELLLSEMERDYGLGDKLKSLDNDSRSSLAYILAAPIVSDPKKAQEMAKLITDYTKVCYEEMNFYSKLCLPEGLKSYLKEIIYFRPRCYFADNDLVTDQDGLMTCIEEFKASFSREKDTFEEYFTKDKLSVLFGVKQQDIQSLDVDFFEQYKYALWESELNGLKGLVDAEKQLMAVWPRFLVNDKIKLVKSKISSKKKDMYDSILAWYTKERKRLDKRTLGISSDILFDNNRALENSLRACRREISQMEEAIDTIEECAKQSKKALSDQRAKYSSEKEEIAQKIAVLSGRDKIPEEPLMSKEADKNLDNLAKAAAIHYMLGLVQRVEVVAEVLAQLEEARLGSFSNIQAGDETTAGGDSLGNSADGHSLTKRYNEN